MARRDTEHSKIFSGQPLNIANVTTFGKEFPLATGYLRMNLRFNLAVVIGTGTTPISRGELKIIKRIFLQTDAGETLVNAPGDMMYHVATYKGGTPPRKDNIAAATATYRVNLPIWFVDPDLLRPFDTVLDTSRYNHINLEITMGSVADLFGTVGTSAVTATLDCEIEHTAETLAEQALPVQHIHYAFAPPIDANNATEIDLPRSQDLSIKRLFVHSGSGGAAGVPYGGTGDDGIQDTVNIEDHNGFITRGRIHEMVQDQNKIDAGLENVQAGMEVHDFVIDGSLSSALYTGDKAKLVYNWENKAGVAGSDIVTAGFEGVRSLK